MRIRRSIVFNLIAFAVPTLIIFVSYPVLLHGLGAEQFGLFTLAVSLAASLSFLDLGLSPSTVRFVALELSRGDRREAGNVIATSLAFYLGVALLISTTVFLLAPWLTQQFQMPADLMPEAQKLFRIVAVQVVISMIVNAMQGVFKATDHFDFSMLATGGLSLSMFGVPALAVYFKLAASMSAAALYGLMALTFVIVLIFAVVLYVCLQRNISVRSARVRLTTLKKTLGFGSILTLHSIAGMLFVSGQRILIGILLGPAAVAVYQLGYTVVSKVHAVLNAASEVIFPIASSTRTSTDGLLRLYRKGMAGILGIAVVMLGTLVLLAKPLLSLWVGEQMAAQVAPLILPLSGAFLFVALTVIPYHVMNGLGRPIVNVIMSVSNVVLFSALLLSFWTLNKSLMIFALCYAGSNMLVSIAYQYYCYRVVVRRAVLGETVHES